MSLLKRPFLGRFFLRDPESINTEWLKEFYMDFSQLLFFILNSTFIFTYVPREA